MAATVSNRRVQKSMVPKKWEEARQKEIQSFNKFDVYDVVDMQDIPNDHAEPIGPGWFYALKNYPYDMYHPNNLEAEKNAGYKARLIFQGMDEKVNDTYSPTPSPESVRLCLALIIICDWDIKFPDVSTAFLHADTLGIPYVYPPDTEKLQDTTKV